MVSPARRHRLGSRLAALAPVILAAALPASVASARPFSAPVQLSRNGLAGNASAGVDGAGNVTAIWSDNAFTFADHPAGGAWSAPATFTVGAGAAFATLRMAAAGTATVVSWNSGQGLYAQDRPSGGAWSAPVTLVGAPQLITPSHTGAPQVNFLENAAGDAAVVYELYSGGVQIAVSRRAAGGSWTAPEIVASSAALGPITLAGAAIGDGGDVVVTWETYQVVCQRYCHDIDYVVHASREPAPGGGWTDSGPLGAPGSAYVATAAVDPVGGAVALTQTGSVATTIQAWRQRKAGGKWNGPVTAYTAKNSEVLLWGAEASRYDRATLLAGDLGAVPGAFEAVDGAIGPDSWGAGTNLTAGDVPAPVLAIRYGASPAGGLAVAWVDADGSMRAASRSSAGAAWSASQTLAAGSACNIGGVVCTGAVGAAAGGGGRAVVLYIRADPDLTTHTLFAATN